MPENYFILPFCIKAYLARDRIQVSKSFSFSVSHYPLIASIIDEKSDVNLILVLLYVLSDSF